MRSFATTLFSAALLFGGTALVLSGGTAQAAQNVANTSQKGSLLMWPLIEIGRNGETEDTIIEISNDGIRTVTVVCYYVNEKKGRVDFDFTLTGKQTVSWSVLTGDSDPIDGIAPPFPDYAGTPAYPPATGNYLPGSVNSGELVCFATNHGATAQIAWNHLTGTATVTEYEPNDGSPSATAFRYNAWSFVARNAAGLPSTSPGPHGTPGRLELTGNGAGTYDACPLYNIANFMPNGAYLGGLRTVENELAVISCNQDLRQDYDLYLTKLQFTVWNALELSRTGAFVCVDSVNSVELGGGSSYLVNGSHFDYSTLRTQNARFQVRGVASTQCPGSVNSALLGVHSSEVCLSQVALASRDPQCVGSEAELGSTTHGAGAAPGFVLWDPYIDPPTKPSKR